jgi:hypothetical protein
MPSVRSEIVIKNMWCHLGEDNEYRISLRLRADCEFVAGITRVADNCQCRKSKVRGKGQRWKQARDTHEQQYNYPSDRLSGL